MGETVSLTSPQDGFAFGAYRAPPPRRAARRPGADPGDLRRHRPHPRAGRRLRRRRLRDPRARRSTTASSAGFEAGYDAEGVAHGPALLRGGALGRGGRRPRGRDRARWRRRCSWPATAGAARRPGWRPAAARASRRPPASTAGASPSWSARRPRCPIILHFGRRDPTIPPAVVEAIAEAHPDMPDPPLRRRPRLRLRPPRRLQPRRRPPRPPAHPAALRPQRRRPGEARAVHQTVPMEPVFESETRRSILRPIRSRTSGSLSDAAHQHAWASSTPRPARVGRRRRRPGSGRRAPACTVPEDERRQRRPARHHRQHRDHALAKAGAEADPDVASSAPARTGERQSEDQRQAR